MIGDENAGVAVDNTTVEKLEAIFETLWKVYRPTIKRVIVEGPGVSHDWEYLSDGEKIELLIDGIYEFVMGDPCDEQY